ncbi:hypothetical protein [Halomonas sp. SpR8]|uniref:hypothetical protein n=1 Tax=Halomonas sp. SpR8 TaxID=3050463 RepID=UPI0027E4DE3C|nr:hypothetical protein [Halomonas sp. SpR8]MDQ7730191.1 hypothetical protein [Halomonas sp. SpR8]
MRFTAVVLSTGIASLYLAACSQQVDTNNIEVQNIPNSEPSQYGLSALSEEDMRNTTLQGELGCSFTASNEDVLLIAKGYVGSSEPSEGVIKLDRELLQIKSPGGFDGMVRGTTFEGEDYTVLVTVTGDATVNGESPPYPGELTLKGADQSVIIGQWVCGP